MSVVIHDRIYKPFANAEIKFSCAKSQNTIVEVDIGGEMLKGSLILKPAFDQSGSRIC